MMKKVIIIDDSVTSLNLIKNKFINADWEVFGTTSAKDGFSMIFDIAPDLIITDALMPVIGGFQLIKMIKENDKISKIPVIIYSILSESNAKYYTKENSTKYFLTKNDNIDELLDFANNIINENPIDKEYKLEILKSKIHFNDNLKEIKIPEKLDYNNIKLDKYELEQKFKEKYNFNTGDEKIFSDFFAILYPILKYELCAVCVNQPLKKERILFFDIKDLIISPIFQNLLMKRFSADSIVLFKKYAPNLKMITNEEEFYSKIEFNFEYKEKNIANIIFYSKEKSKWENEENIEIIKDAIYNFLKAYYINKHININQKEDFGEVYFGDNFNILKKQKLSHKDDNIYAAIINITNYSALISNLSNEEIDIINLKISEKIMSCLEKDEQVIKNDENEYSIVIYVKDEKNLKARFDFIINTLEQIKSKETKLELVIGASNCTIDNSYNIFEAQKRALEALEETTKTEKVVFYNAEK